MTADMPLACCCWLATACESYCPPGHYMATECAENVATTCKQCTQCWVGQEEVTACSNSSDTVCQVPDESSGSGSGSDGSGIFSAASQSIRGQRHERWAASWLARHAPWLAKHAWGSRILVVAVAASTVQGLLLCALVAALAAAAPSTAMV